ncbi:hypothetical protein GF366_00445 [Candidatus Peregrinibacteria bacterium]|nr:hypothetical protein [Candidatus Peregrinibacteria bacterium]
MKRGYEKVQLTLYYLLKSLIALGLILSLIRQEWINAVLIALILILTYLPSIIKWKYRLYLPLEFDLFIIIFIFLSLFLGEIHTYYYRFWWWDIFLHAESGFLLGIFGYILVYVLNEQKNINITMKPGFLSLFAFTFAMATGTLWEIFEFIMDNIFGFNMQKSGLMDTMGDLILNASGALLISVIGYLWMKKKIKFFVFDTSIHKFVQKNQHLFK